MLAVMRELYTEVRDDGQHHKCGEHRDDGNIIGSKVIIRGGTLILWSIIAGSASTTWNICICATRRRRRRRKSRRRRRRGGVSPTMVFVNTHD